MNPLRLTKGYHAMRFAVYGRHPSSYIAELYWRVPGKSVFELIEPEAYAQTTYFVPVIRQQFGHVVSSFFSYSVQKKLRLVTTEDVLTSVQFKALASNSLEKAAAPQPDRRVSRSSVSGPAPETPEPESTMTCKWDFGDGKTSTEKDPLHVYRRTGDYTVSLTVRNDLGLEDTYSTVLEIEDDDAEKISIEWELQQEDNLLDPGTESLDAILVCNLISVVPKEFTIKSWITTLTGREELESRTLTMEPRKVIEDKLSIPIGDESFTMNWGLYNEGIPILRRGLRVIKDTDRMPAVSLQNASIVDDQGNHVVVLLTGERNTERRKFSDVFDPERKKTLKVALADNSLCELQSAVAKDRLADLYFSRLGEMLKKKFPSTNVVVKRFENGNPGLGYTPVKRLVEMAHEIQEFAPDVIVVSLDSKDAETFRIDRLTRYYAFEVHNFIANTGAKIVLVSPPPDSWKPYRSKIYANMISELSIVHNTGLADVFQSVSLYSGNWRDLYRKSENALSKYLNSEGQSIIADTIFKAILSD